MANTTSRFIKIDGVLQRMPTMENPYTTFVNSRKVAVDTLAPVVVDQPQNRTVTVNQTPETPVENNGFTPEQTAQYNKTLGMFSGGTNGATGETPTPVFQPQETTTPNYMDDFNKGLLDMLGSAKGMTTADYLARKRALERASLGETTKMTPEELRTLSPDQQAAMRTGKVSALRPEIDANAYELEKAQQTIDNFFKVYSEAQKFGADFADKMVAPETIIKNAQKIIESNPDSMSTVLAGFNDKSKSAILGGLDYSKIGASKEVKAPEVKEINGVSMQWNPTTGSWEKIPGAGGGNDVISPYQQERMTRNLNSIAELRSTASPWNTGWGSMLNGVPATEAKAFQQNVETLKANITFGELTAMREASKTGGALGQVSDNENRLLGAALGSLDTGLSKEAFLTNLQKIEDSINRWKAAVSQYGGTAGGSGSTGADIVSQVIYNNKKYNVDSSGNMTLAE